MKIAIVSSLLAATGNSTTADRMRLSAQLAGLQVVMVDVTAGASAASGLSGVECAVGLHLLHAGRLLQGLPARVPYCLVLGGTDVNEYCQDADLRRQMAAAVDGAFRVVSFDANLAGRFSAQWPQYQQLLVVVPPAPSVAACEPCDALDAIGLGAGSGANVFLLPCGIRPVKDPLFIARSVSQWHQQDPSVQLGDIGPSLRGHEQ
eukprot:TRINITY_DN15775_c0_g1_i1.p1 TRINITY_DN15775_c0_g1~~TRINITY_DN15775_c0_g1_i1.p1  ORF type:complete len:205 (-),score=56.54 TRINITY_DN15775_c0_g1_i1:54-668(-)